VRQNNNPRRPTTDQYNAGSGRNHCSPTKSSTTRQNRERSNPIAKERLRGGVVWMEEPPSHRHHHHLHLKERWFGLRGKAIGLFLLERAEKKN